MFHFLESVNFLTLQVQWKTSYLWELVNQIILAPDKVIDACIESLKRKKPPHLQLGAYWASNRNSKSSFKNRYGLDYDPQDEVMVTVGVSKLFWTCDDHIPQSWRWSTDTGSGLSGLSGMRVDCRRETCLSSDLRRKWVQTHRWANLRKRLHQRRKRFSSDIRTILQEPSWREKNCWDCRLCPKAWFGLLFRMKSTAIWHMKASIAALHPCPGMRERTIVMNGFSKSYAMTGLRIGYVYGPRGIPRRRI